VDRSIISRALQIEGNDASLIAAVGAIWSRLNPKQINNETTFTHTRA